MTKPTQMRNALQYVLTNWLHHRPAHHEIMEAVAWRTTWTPSRGPGEPRAAAPTAAGPMPPELWRAVVNDAAGDAEM